MSVLINILLILASLVLIVVVLMQEGNKQGLGVIGGAAETFLGKNKAKSYEGKLLNITRIAAVLFVILAVVSTWLNARTYTVTYYNEDGSEYFPALQDQVAYYNTMVQLGQAGEGAQQTTYENEIQAITDEATAANWRLAFSKGTELKDYAVPAKEGYSGKWLTEDGKELPAKMKRSDIKAYATYTVNEYTLAVVDNGVNGLEEGAVAEPLFTVTANYGTEIEYPETVKLPEKMEGYNIVWNTGDGELPATMPAAANAGETTTVEVLYTPGNYISYFDENGEEVYASLTDWCDTAAFYNLVYAPMMSMTEEEYMDYIVNYDAEAEQAMCDEEAARMYDEAYQKAVEADDMDSIRQFVATGSDITLANVPAKEGYNGKWVLKTEEAAEEVVEAVEETEEAVEETAEEIVETVEEIVEEVEEAAEEVVEEAVEEVVETEPAETEAAEETAETEEAAEEEYWPEGLPKTMDGSRYELKAEYEIGTYTLKIVDNTAKDEEGKAIEKVLFEQTYTYGDAVEIGEIELPEAPEGMTAEWSEEFPSTMPGKDLTIEAKFVAPATEETTDAE